MRAIQILTLFALAACTSVAPIENPRFARQLPDGGGLSHVARITPFLYRGAQPDDEGFERLAAMGIRTVIDLRSFFGSRRAAEAAGMRYVAMPIYAGLGSSPPSEVQLRHFFDIVRNPADQPVFFHCMAGKDRTGMMAALFRIEHQGWSNEEAIAEMQAFGFHDVFRDLIGFVRSYEPRGFAPPR